MMWVGQTMPTMSALTVMKAIATYQKYQGVIQKMLIDYFPIQNFMLICVRKFNVYLCWKFQFSY